MSSSSSSSSVSGALCKICMEVLPTAEMFRSKCCSHVFCRGCMRSYIKTKVGEKQVVVSTVKCPEIRCKGVLKPKWCRTVVSPKVFHKWEKALRDSMPCARCGVAWHAGVSCEEFRRVGPDERGREDRMLMELFRRRGWKRCPRCRFFVERTAGCLHITCRCGFEFCYGCGLPWSLEHNRCHT